MNKKFINNKKGSALLITLLILTSVLTVSLAAAALVMNNVFIYRTQIDSVKAFYASEVGAERVLRAVRMECFNVASCDINTNKYVDLDNGACVDTLTSYTLPNSSTYYIIFSAANAFRSYGYSPTGIRRVIEVSYN